MAVNDSGDDGRGHARSSGSVLGNDTDVDAGTTLTAALVASPAHGTLTLTADGSFTYTPAANFNGTDSFTYTASDGTAVSNVATVTITVTAVNDAPVAVNDSGDDDGRDGGQRRRARQRHGRRTGTTLTAALVAGPAHGTVTLDRERHASPTRRPRTSTGRDSFTYTASDGTAVSNVATVTITVTGVNDAPVAANDTASTTEETRGQRHTCSATTPTSTRHDADARRWSRARRTARVTLNADGSFTYTPAANFNGTDSFTYTASDGTAVSNVATVTITVTRRQRRAGGGQRHRDDDGGHAPAPAATCSATTPTPTPARR